MYIVHVDVHEHLPYMSTSFVHVQVNVLVNVHLHVHSNDHVLRYVSIHVHVLQNA
jgi:hypothetical protein